MTYDRYYYSILSPQNQRAYRLLYDTMQSFIPFVKLPKSVPIKKIFNYISLDNPHLFYVDFTHYTYLRFGDFVEVGLNYWYTKSEEREIKGKIDRVLGRMIRRVSGENDFEKIRSVHDLLVSNVVYDYMALEDIERHFPRSNTLMGVLFFKSAVCDGISKTFKMLLNILDIKCIIAEGYSLNGKEPHAWNIVKLDGRAHHIDVTWDINLSTRDNFSHDYFLLSDEELGRDHRYEPIYPVCAFRGQKA